MKMVLGGAAGAQQAVSWQRLRPSTCTQRPSKEKKLSLNRGAGKACARAGGCSFLAVLSQHSLLLVCPAHDVAKTPKNFSDVRLYVRFNHSSASSETAAAANLRISELPVHPCLVEIAATI